MGEKTKKGKIKFFNKEKGFGFIEFNKSEKDLFFHISDVRQGDKDSITENMNVEFEIGENQKGRCAKNVKLLVKRNKYLIPKDTLELDLNSIDNFNLKLNKFPKYLNEKFSFYNKEKQIDITSENNFGNGFVRSISNNYKKTIENIGYKIVSQTFNPGWRFVVGLGGESVYETSITLHHIYGFPYIPGQAVKGVVRSYFIKTEFEKTGEKWEQISVFEKFLENFDFEKDVNIGFEKFKGKFSVKKQSASEGLYRYFYENSVLKDNSKRLIKRFQTIYGTQTNQGKIVFFDAYPITEPKLKVDVMNPHYSKYYGGEKDEQGNFIPPADYLNPVPIFFLTVEDTKFEFVIGAKRVYENYLNEMEVLLKNALFNHGIGAKTSVGYGIFK